MNLYLDDNFSDKLLATLLVKAGHKVVRPAEAGLTGAKDARHLEYAIREGLAVLTADRGDFRDLHQLILTAAGTHLRNPPGAVRQRPKTRYETRPYCPRHQEIGAVRH